MSKERFLPDDVIAGMLGFVKVKFLESSQYEFHKAIYEMREEYPELLGTFAFSQGDTGPFSTSLEQVLAHMQLSRLMVLESPDFQRYVLNKKAQKLIREDLEERFNAKEIRQLRIMAKELEMRFLIRN